jgi:hypothetical protein
MGSTFVEERVQNLLHALSIPHFTINNCPKWLLYSSAVFLNHRNVPQYGDLETLVNVRLLYILVYGLHYSLGGQAIVTVNPLASIPNLTDQELHLATGTQQDRARLLLLH